ncbi:MAG: DUF5011 domain-containing protein [Bacilli bacterium]|nr:DUF5011 domain-containing protein [Bacilli bacterium]
MKDKTKLILIIVMAIDGIILGILGFYFINKDKGIEHEVTFKYVDEDNVKSEVNVNSEEIPPTNIFVYIDGEDRTNLLEIDTSMVDLTKLGTYKIKYYVFYDKQRYEEVREITVVDEEAPKINLKGGTVTLLVGEKYTEPGYEVVDNYDKELNDKVTIEGEVDSSKAGTYKLTYKVSDTSGNTSEASRNITVKKPLPVVSTPPKEQKVVVPKVVETNYKNTIKKNKYTASSITFEGYLKEVQEENKIKLVNDDNSYEYKLNMNGNNYSFSINPDEINNGTYKVYINEEKLYNKMAPVERLARAKVGSKLVNITYDNDEVTISISNHSYQYDVLINPGHGGWDSGASNEYAYEKDMNLTVSMYEKCRYEAHGLRVYMTRTNDNYNAKMGPSGLIDLHKIAWEMGYVGAVSKIVYSNHHNAIPNKTYMGYEILVAGALTSSELSNELAIANKWNNVFDLKENHTRFYARDYDTERIYSKLGGEVYSFKDNYAVNRIPLSTANVKSIIYEGCYMTNKDEFKWYWLDGNWYKVSEAKIEVYVNSLGLTYNSDNASCM